MKTLTPEQKSTEKKAVPSPARVKPKLDLALKVIKKPVSPGAFDC